MLPNVIRWKCRTADAYKTQLISPINAQKPQQMHASVYVCCFPLAYVDLSIHASNIKCRMDNALRPWLMFTNWCTRTTADVCMPWLMVYIVGWRHLTHKHMPRPCMQTFAEFARHWPMTLARYEHVPYVLSRLGWKCMTLADVACQMRTCLVGCMHTLIDVVYHWSSSDDKYV